MVKSIDFKKNRDDELSNVFGGVSCDTKGDIYEN